MPQFKSGIRNRGKMARREAPPNERAHTPLQSLLRLSRENRITGDELHVGIELEVEFARIPDRTPMGAKFEAAMDGSLRGNGREYISIPLPVSEVLGNLELLAMELDFSESMMSTRVSTHIHMNVRDLTLCEMTNILCLWYIIEEPYIRTLQGRSGNLFCLRSKDASYQLTFIRDALQAFANPSPAHRHYDLGNSLRYSAVNLCSLQRFGTLEFRVFPGVGNDPVQAYEWVQDLKELWSAAKRFASPSDIISRFSGYGPTDFVETFLPRIASRLNSLEPLAHELPSLIQTGMRNAQTIAYSIPTWAKPSEALSSTTSEEQELVDAINAIEQTQPIRPIFTDASGTTPSTSDPHHPGEPTPRPTQLGDWYPIDDTFTAGPTYAITMDELFEPARRGE